MRVKKWLKAVLGACVKKEVTGWERVMGGFCAGYRAGFALATEWIHEEKIRNLMFKISRHPFDSEAGERRSRGR
jgi:hypothetical protein